MLDERSMPIPSGMYYVVFAPDGKFSNATKDFQAAKRLADSVCGAEVRGVDEDYFDGPGGEFGYDYPTFKINSTIVYKSGRNTIGVKSIQQIGSSYLVTTTEESVLLDSWNVIRCALGEADANYLLSRDGKTDESLCFFILPTEWQEMLELGHD